MRKIIACMLILSMLSTTGVMCFAKDETSIAIQKVEKVLDKMDAPVSEKAEIKKDLESIKNGEALTPQKKESIGNRIKNFFKKHWGKVVTIGGIILTAIAATIITLIAVLVGKHNKNKTADMRDAEVDNVETVDVTLRVSSQNIQFEIGEVSYSLSASSNDITISVNPDTTYRLIWNGEEYYVKGNSIIGSCKDGKQGQKELWFEEFFLSIKLKQEDAFTASFNKQVHFSKTVELNSFAGSNDNERLESLLEKHEHVAVVIYNGVQPSLDQKVLHDMQSSARPHFDNFDDRSYKLKECISDWIDLNDCVAVWVDICESDLEINGLTNEQLKNGIRSGGAKIIEYRSNQQVQTFGLDTK